MLTTKTISGTRFRLQADVEDYKQMLKEGWAGSQDGVVERVEGDAVLVRFQDGQGWRFTLRQFPEVTVPHAWQGEIAWGD